MLNHSMLIVILFLTNVLLFDRSRGTGTVSVLLCSYNNSEGLENNGNCCEGTPRFCNGGNHCDHYFIVCLDQSHGSENDMNKCDIGKYTTGTTNNRNEEIRFGSSIGGKPNPKELHFKTWLDTVVVKVEVWDDDTTNDDYVDLLTTSVNMEASRARVEMKYHSFTVKKRTELDFKLAVFCDENWYPPHCDIYCNPSLGNYSCGSDGEKVCNPGLTGENCTKTINCSSDPCAKSGKCVDKNDGYICECQPGYTGLRCETKIDADPFTTAKDDGTDYLESSTIADDDGTDAPESQTGMIGIISTVVLLIVFAVITLVLWKMYQKRQKQQNRPKNADDALNEDTTVYFTAQPVQQHHQTEDNIYFNNEVQATTDTDAVLYDNSAYGTSATNVFGNASVVSTYETQAHAENDTYVVDNPVYDTSNAEMCLNTQNNTSGNTTSGGNTKSRDEIDTVEYTNAVCVVNTGDVYAVVNN